MATNSNLESKNKVLQSLDLYANDLLNVSHITGNKYSTRTKNLEISTRDFTDSTNAGNLQLRAGVSTSGTSGKVHVYAGTTENEPLAGISGIEVLPNNKVFISESASNNQPGIVTIQAGANGTTFGDAGNAIQLTTTDNTLNIDNSHMVVNSDSQMVLKAQSTFEGAVTTGITLNQSGSIQVLTPSLEETGTDVLYLRNEEGKTTYDDSSALDGKNLVKLTKTDNVLQINTTTGEVAAKDSFVIKTKDSGAGALLSENSITLADTNQTLTIDNKNFLQTTDDIYEIKVPGTADITNAANTSGTYVKISKPNSTDDTLDLITDYADIDIRYNFDLDIDGDYTDNIAGNVSSTITGTSSQTITSQATETYITGVQLYADTAANKIELVKTPESGHSQLEITNATSEINSTSKMILETQSALGNTDTPNRIVLAKTNDDQTISLTSNNISETARTSIIDQAPTIKLHTADSTANEIKLEQTNNKLTVTNTTEDHTSQTQFYVKVASDANSINMQSADSAATPGLIIKNNYADITSQNEIKIQANNEGNRIRLTSTGNLLEIDNTKTDLESLLLDIKVPGNNETTLAEIKADNNTFLGTPQLDTRVTGTQTEKVYGDYKLEVGQNMAAVTKNGTTLPAIAADNGSAKLEVIASNGNNNPNKITLTQSDSKLEVKNKVTDIDSLTSITETAPTVTLQTTKSNPQNKIELGTDSNDKNKLTVINDIEEHTSNSSYQITVPKATGGITDTVFTVQADTGANDTVSLQTARLDLALDDTDITSDDIKLWTPQSASDTSRYIQLNKADSGFTTDSNKVPGLKVKNDYTEFEADKSLTAYTNENNSLTLTDTTSGNTVTGTAQLKTTEGTITGTSFIKIQTPTGTAGTNTHIVLDESGSKKLDIQSANGLNTKVLVGDSTETVDLGDKTIIATAGDIDLTADAGHIKLQSQASNNSTSSNYLTLDHTQNTLRANNQTATINSIGTLILENNPGTTTPESPTTNYIKLADQGQIEAKSGTITDIGTTSVILQADDANNQIVLAKTDGVKSNLLTTQNNYETHKTENEFKIQVPSDAGIDDIHSYNFTATGTAFDIVATTINNQTSTEAKLSSDSINIASMGDVRSQSKQGLYLTAGLSYNSSNPNLNNTNEILIGLKDIESDNSIRLSQTDGSKHDVLEVRNKYTRVNTSNYNLTASNTLKIQSSNHGAAGRDRHAAFELSATQETATVKLNDLKVNQSIKLGNTVTGDTIGLDPAANDQNPVRTYAGTASITVAGAISQLGLTGTQRLNPDPESPNYNKPQDNLVIQLGGLKIGDNVSGDSAAAKKTLLEVEHANITGYTRVKNLDITGDIRIGDVDKASASAASGLTKADNSSIGVSFSDFSTDTDDGTASNSNLTVKVNSFNLAATTTGTINTGSTLDIDSTGALTLDSNTSISIGTAQDKPVTINASDLTITGNGAQTNNLQITSNSAAGSYTTAGQSYIQSDVMKVESDFYGNNVHMYWDSNTGSLVFASV